MISSTSSSEPYWPRIWALTLLLVLGVVGGWEYLLRQAELGPDYADNRSLWADTRNELNRPPARPVALLGASRIQRAIDVETLSGALGRPVYQLAVEGSSAFAVLENLAVDPRFRGVVVYSVAPAFTFNRFQRRLDFGRQRDFLDYYLDQGLAKRLETKLRLGAQGRLAFLSPDANLGRVLPALIETGGLPERDEKTTFRDRVVKMDYDRSRFLQNEEGIMVLYLERSAPYNDDEWQASLNYFRTLVDMLNAKGAEVVFVRLPSSENVSLLESALFPRDRFWGAMEQQLDARFLYTPDYPALDGDFLSSDGSHIRSDKMVEFTKAFAEVLKPALGDDASQGRGP